MRPKIILILSLPVLLVVAAVIFLKQHPSPAPEIAAAAPATTITPAPAPVSMPVPAPVVARKMTPEEREAAIDAEKDRLSSWQMNSDSASLSNILADLASPEKEIRMAAIEAAKQFGDTNAIPALKAAVDNTDDTEEKIELLKAADFIALPDVTFSKPGDIAPKTPEQIQADDQKKAAKQARQISDFQKHNPNLIVQPASSTNTPDAAPGN
ncbi:MAG TPA: HEAT repeat domain-containing protein [Dongiaceae bacterium]|jgi:hypothetical protein|nr:HEAT repeat domain-containing protein [Dongiaceae bacterium]